MKNINESFDDKEFEDLKKTKKERGDSSWREYILGLTKFYKENC